MKVLIVEPNNEIADLTSMFCYLSNVVATTTETFRDAYELACTNDFDGFIVDIPVCENYVFDDIDKLRQYGQRQQMKQRFVGTAASILPSSCAKALMHLDCLYPKPVSLQLLLDAVYGTSNTSGTPPTRAG